MNNFNQISKILKSSLKKKISITTAAIIAFLMSADIYAQEIIVPMKEIPQIQQGESVNIEIKEDESLTKGIRTPNGEKIYGGNVNIVNNGEINFNITSEDAQNLHLHGMRIYGESVNIENNGNIIVTKDSNVDNLGNGIVGIEVGSSNVKGAKVINNGLIKIINKDKNIHSFGSGLVITSTVMGINNGQIKVVGSGVGARIDGEFSNYGTIDITESISGEAIKIQGSGKAINEGTILLSINNNNKAITTSSYGTGVNSGKIILTDIESSNLNNFDANSLFVGNVINKGTIEDANGNIIYQSSDITIGDDLSISKLKGMLEYAPGSSLAVNKNGGILKGGSDELSFNSLNINGNLILHNTKPNTTNHFGVNLSNGTINISNDGKIIIGNSKNADKNLTNGETPTGYITLTNVNINGKKDIEKGADIIFDRYYNPDTEHLPSTLTLVNSSVNANIGDSSEIGIINVLGDTTINGIINVKEFNIGNTTLKANAEKVNKTILTSTSEIETGTTINIAQDGRLELQLGSKGENAFNNSTGITVNGDGIDDNGDIILDTTNLTGEGIKIALGENNTFTDVDVTTTSGKNGVYIASDIVSDENGNSSVDIKYNNHLFEDEKINNINIASINTNNIFENTDLNLRKHQMEKIYYDNIYAKTAQASYTGIKLTEEKLRELPSISQVGKWSTIASGVHSANKNKEHGFNNKIKTSGLIASMEYGMSSTTSMGIALSGAYQNIKTATGEADGELMYFGIYAKKEYGPYKLMTGIGYQYGHYDADNTTGYANSSDKYDSNGLSAYVEGKYLFDMTETTTFEPKVKFGYTHIKQKHAKDAYIGITDAKLSSFDAEIGADITKKIILENGKVDLSFGASYTRAMGDTDKKFKGEFVKSNGSFDITGANITKNSAKIDLSVKMTKDSGLFYTGGITYKVGSDDTKDYSFTLGAGYRF